HPRICFTPRCATTRWILRPASAAGSIWIFFPNTSRLPRAACSRCIRFSISTDAPPASGFGKFSAASIFLRSSSRRRRRPLPPRSSPRCAPPTNATIARSRTYGGQGSRPEPPIMSESPLQTSGDLAAQPPMPVRRLHNYLYCPRLFYLQWVENIFEENADTAAGSATHRQSDQPSRFDEDRAAALREGLPE